MNSKATMSRHSNSRRVHSRREQQRTMFSSFCQRAIFILVVAVLVFAPLAFGARPMWAQGAIEIAVELAAVFWVVRILTDHGMRAIFSPLGGPLLLFALYAIIRSVLSEVE